MVAGVVTLFLAGFGWTTLLNSNLRALQADSASLREEIGNLELLAGEVEQYPAIQAELEQRLSVLADLKTSTGWIASILVALEAAVPEGAWLTELQLFDRRLDLYAASADLDGAAFLMEALQVSECFESVALKSVESSPDGQTFFLQATVLEGLCAAGTPGGRSLFLSPNLADALRPRATIHPLLRWEPRDYELVAIEIGAATLRDPEDRLHRVMVHSSVGSGRATVTFITDDSIVLTEDELVDADTGRTKTDIVTLTLVE